MSLYHLYFRICYESIKFYHYVMDPTETKSLSSNNVYHILCTQKGEVYMATFGGGLNKLEQLDAEGNASFKVYSKEDGLHSDILMSLEEDVEGNLWMSTENGLSKFVVEQQRFENYNERDFGKKVRFEQDGRKTAVRGGGFERRERSGERK